MCLVRVVTVCRRRLVSFVIDFISDACSDSPLEEIAELKCSVY